MDKENTYPIQYIEPIQLRDGTLVQLRPIHRDDRRQVKTVNTVMSQESLYQRFMGFVNITDKMVERFTNLDYKSEMAIVAEIKKGDKKQIIGVARIAKNKANDAEFAIIIGDAWQGLGLGKIMTDNILNIAKDIGYQTVSAYVFSKNKAMLRILEKRNFIFKNTNTPITHGVLDFNILPSNPHLDWIEFEV